MHDLIRTGAWPVGVRIPAEPDLVREFGVGRNTIREAVRALEHEGLLAPRRGDGTYVRSRNVLTEAIARCVRAEEIADLLVTRRALESEAAALTAMRARFADVARFRGLLEHARAALDQGDLDRHVDADIAFHAAIVHACGNGLLIELYEGIGEVLRRSMAAVVGRGAAARKGPDGHDEVVDAIAARDVAAARKAVHHYLDDAMDAAR